MLSEESIARQIAPGRSVLVGTVDPAGRPACCRGVGLRLAEDRQGVTVYLPVATGAETVANLATTGRIAVVSSEPLSHETLQLKGRIQAVRIAAAEEEALVRECLERFADALDQVGLPRAVTRTLACWPAFAVDVAVEAVFDQTPGPRAGVLVRSQ
jgi:hypothetical protein